MGALLDALTRSRSNVFILRNSSPKRLQISAIEDDGDGASVASASALCVRHARKKKRLLRTRRPRTLPQGVPEARVGGGGCGDCGDGGGGGGGDDTSGLVRGGGHGGGGFGGGGGDGGGLCARTTSYHAPSYKSDDHAGALLIDLSARPLIADQDHYLPTDRPLIGAPTNRPLIAHQAPTNRRAH